MINTIIIICYKNKKIKIDFKNNYISGFMFFLYAICFSYSYINMAAGIGTATPSGWGQAAQAAYD